MCFSDVTTISFASEQQDELRRKGWSKDGKPHRVQVVLALFQDGAGAADRLQAVSRQHGGREHP